jgi:hypothetical protein
VFCGTGAFWTGSYKTTTPDYLDVSDPYPGSVATSPAGTAYTSTIKAESEGHVVLHSENAPTAFTVECNASLDAIIEQHGPSTTAGGKVSSLVFTTCTNGATVVVNKPGTQEVHSLENGNGTLTWSGAEITIHVPGLNVKCIYTTSGTDVGALTGSKNTGATATLDFNSSTIGRTGGSVFCGTGGFLTGNLKVTTPDYLDIS